MKVAYPPVLLRQVLDNVLAPVWEDGHITVKDLWESFARYPYLPRLRDLDVLMETVRQGPASTTWQAEGFATAAAFEDGNYLDLVGGSIPGTVTASTLLVKPSIAVEQQEREAVMAGNAGDVYVKDREDEDTEADRDGAAGGQRRQPTKFYGRVELDPSRYARDFGRVQQEVLTHLSGQLGTELKIVVEIQAANDEGFDDTTVRNISENARTLKFDHHEFE